jgi:hypothetical protein
MFTAKYFPTFRIIVASSNPRKIAIFSLLYPEDECTANLRNFGSCLSHDTVYHSRIINSPLYL